MRKKQTLCMLAACTGLLVLSGCNSEAKKTYDQAKQDLAEGIYDDALTGYEASAKAGYKTADSWRGVGIARLRMGKYQEAVEAFTSALDSDKITKTLQKDILSYRATAQLEAGLYDEAMADCQTLASDFSMDGNTYYLTGCVALAMDSYEEASSDFTEAYSEDPTYDMAIQIYEAYLQHDMEADGTRYLEAALQTEAKSAQDHCDRGQVYYYMEDYKNAQKELTEAVNKKNTEAMILLGDVYMAQEDTANARSMYQQYVDTEGSDPAKGYNGLALCDIADGNYDSALENISSGLSAASSDEMQDLLFNEITVYEKQLDFATALSKAEEYVKMFPADEAGTKELTFLQSRVN